MLNPSRPLPALLLLAAGPLVSHPPSETKEPRKPCLTILRARSYVEVQAGTGSYLRFQFRSPGYDCSVAGLRFGRPRGGRFCVPISGETREEDDGVVDSLTLEAPDRDLPTLLGRKEQIQALIMFRDWVENEYFLGWMNGQTGYRLFPSPRRDPRMSDLQAFLRDTSYIELPHSAASWPEGQGRRLNGETGDSSKSSSSSTGDRESVGNSGK